MFLTRKQMNESLIAQEWRQEGAMMARRESILMLLAMRHNVAQADEFAASLDLIEEPDRLAHLFHVALTCPTLDEFRAAL